MDTKPLERFATWARRELITVVDAQASAVLASGSVARTERPDTVRRLESEIERHGRQHVIDKVAYTWFNRIIALRFMDARGYTEAGVVSPAQGQGHGQPEILADAKRGNLDPEVITNSRTADAILGLLDGTRHSTDAEGEAYALLLTEYCRYWHKSMPFMFEREGDYTELLVPANLLADGAILSRARETLTREICEDVEVIGWLYQFYIAERKDEVFAGFKNNNKAGAEEIPAATQLFTPHWIVRYLVENSLGRLWILNRPSSRLVDQMDYYIAPVDEETDFLKISSPEELTVIDPACGSGHMLTYAFDLLYAIYEEEGYAPLEIPGLILSKNLYGTEIDPRAGSLAAFALTMKARAKQRTFFSKKAGPIICVIEPISFRPDEIEVLTAEQGDATTDETFWNQFEHADTLGSLIQPDARWTIYVKAALDRTNATNDILYADAVDRARRLVRQAEILSEKYAVVIANPPYMGGKNMNARLAEFAKKTFPDTKSDLFAMFIERCVAFTKDRGLAAMITMQSWMFISSFEKLRGAVLRSAPLITMAHLGERSFDSIGGAVVSTTAFVLQRSRSGELNACFVRAVDGRNESQKREILLHAAQHHSEHVWRLAPKQLVQIPGAPIAYWLSDAVRAAFEGKTLGQTAFPKVGMQTSNNAKYLRFWWEVSAHKGLSLVSENSEYIPYLKGGSFRRWYGNYEYLMRYGGAPSFVLEQKNATMLDMPRIHEQKVSWTDLTSGDYSSRVSLSAASHDISGHAFYPGEAQTDWVLGFSNSSLFQVFLDTINSSMHAQVGDVARIPALPAGVDVISRNAEVARSRSKSDWDDFETSWDFEGPSWLSAGEIQLRTRLVQWSEQQQRTSHEQQDCETENNRLVAEAFGLEDEVSIHVPLSRVSLTRNVEFRYGTGKTTEEYAALERGDLAAEIVSYAVGCIFGRYSLGAPGLVLADQCMRFTDQRVMIQEYLMKGQSSALRPDADNVIPFVDDGWFEDDIVERFRQFLRAAFGWEYFEENLRFVEESLGVKSIRDYFITKNGKSKFYEEHVQRYKKRPIYWMFSSPKGTFNALIYMHRYTPSTVSTVLNEYLREYRAKLEVALVDAENAAAGGSAKDQKEADRLRKVLVELAEYEHDVLYPLATRQLPIDLDDGVLVNYLRFGGALKDIGLEKDRRKVEGWAWPRYPLEATK